MKTYEVRLSNTKKTTTVTLSGLSDALVRSPIDKFTVAHNTTVHDHVCEYYSYEDALGRFNRLMTILEEK